MVKKSLIIVILSILLGILLYFNFFLKTAENQTRIIDRIPDGDYIGSSSLLKLAEETSPLLYFNKMPHRDLSSAEFLLAQSKNFGINAQEKAYFFINETGDFGLLLNLLDSAKVRLAINKINDDKNLKNKTQNKKVVFFNEQFNCYVHYGSDYLLLYCGKKFPETLERVSLAKYNQQSKLWREYLSLKTFKNESATVFSKSQKILSLGFNYALFSHDSDSLNVTIKCFLHKKTKLSFSVFKSGRCFPINSQSNRSVEFHLNPAELTSVSNFPFKNLLFEQGKKIGFPTASFLKAWGGEFSFSEGGSVALKERYVVSEMDEDFNVSEIVKYKITNVPGYALMFNTNENGPSFIQELLQKGILRFEENHYKILFSPPLQMVKKDNYYLFYSGEKAPQIVENTRNEIIWPIWDENYRFRIDSTNNSVVFASAIIPIKTALTKLKKIIQK